MLGGSEAPRWVGTREGEGEAERRGGAETGGRERGGSGKGREEM